MFVVNDVVCECEDCWTTVADYRVDTVVYRVVTVVSYGREIVIFWRIYRCCDHKLPYEIKKVRSYELGGTVVRYGLTTRINVLSGNYRSLNLRTVDSSESPQREPVLHLSFFSTDKK